MMIDNIRTQGNADDLDNGRVSIFLILECLRSTIVQNE